MKKVYNKIYAHVMDILSNNLPSYLTYHSIDHTLHVLDKAVYIAKKEKVTNKDLWLLKIAALYHDIGFIETHIDHEQIGCRIAKTELKAFDFSNEDIETICKMIMATKIPQQPETNLEKILADADLEYLGSNKFVEIGEQLYKELKHYNDNLTREQWNSIQIDFISKHNYHTAYCKRYRKHQKLKHLQSLK